MITGLRRRRQTSSMTAVDERPQRSAMTFRGTPPSLAIETNEWRSCRGGPRVPDVRLLSDPPERAPHIGGIKRGSGPSTEDEVVVLPCLARATYAWSRDDFEASNTALPARFECPARLSRLTRFLQRNRPHPHRRCRCVCRCSRVRPLVMRRGGCLSSAGTAVADLSQNRERHARRLRRGVHHADHRRGVHRPVFLHRDRAGPVRLR